MKTEDVENMLNRLQTPEPEKIMQPVELKIPLLSYRKSSRAGLWLLVLPLIFAITFFLKMELGVQWGSLDLVRRFFAAIDDNVVLTYLIPVIFLGLPLAAMIINLLAICHFQQNRKSKELIVTIKYRVVNIAIFLLSFAVLIFFLLPDKLAF
jgi:hypothetical protein